MKSNDEINRKIAEFMGLCWHDWSRTDKEKHFPHVWCFKCDAQCYGVGTANLNPDYCSDGSPRRLLKEVVAKL